MCVSLWWTNNSCLQCRPRVLFVIYLIYFFCVYIYLCVNYKEVFRMLFCFWGILADLCAFTCTCKSFQLWRGFDLSLYFKNNKKQLLVAKKNIIFLKKKKEELLKNEWTTTTKTTCKVCKYWYCRKTRKRVVSHYEESDSSPNLNFLLCFQWFSQLLCHPYTGADPIESCCTT